MKKGSLVNQRKSKLWPVPIQIGIIFIGLSSLALHFRALSVEPALLGSSSTPNLFSIGIFVSMGLIIDGTFNLSSILFKAQKNPICKGKICKKTMGGKKNEKRKSGKL